VYKTLRKWCKNKNGASKIIDTCETYHPLWCQCTPTDHTPPPGYSLPRTQIILWKTPNPYLTPKTTTVRNITAAHARATHRTFEQDSPIDQSTGAASAAVSATVPDPLHRRPPHLTSFINSTVHCTGSTSPTLSSTAPKYRRPPLICFTATDSDRNRTGATTPSCSARDLLHCVPHVQLLSRFTDLTVHCMDLLH
jgi:hypothetical protein